MTLLRTLLLLELARRQQYNGIGTPYPDEAVVEVEPEQRRVGRGVLLDGLGDDPADDGLGVRARVLVEPDPELSSSVAVAIAMGGRRSSQHHQEEEDRRGKKQRSRCHCSVHRRRLLLPPPPSKLGRSCCSAKESGKRGCLLACSLLPCFGGSSLALRT